MNQGIRFKGTWKDPIGRIFELDDKIYRGIYPAKERLVLEMFESGLLNELTQKGLFPKTRISDLKLDGFSLILEHERIEPLTYPYEWSFSMLKEAIIFLIELFETARKYGFTLTDCHLYNTTFKGCKPIYLDLGSFKKPSRRSLLAFLSHFLDSYNNVILWKRLEDLEEYDVNKIRSFLFFHYKPSKNVDLKSILRYPTSKDLFNFILKRHRFIGKEWQRKPEGDLLRGLYEGALTLILESDLFIYHLHKLKEEIKSLELEIKTPWEDYYGEKARLTPRFKKIIDYINSFCKDAKTAVSLGANQGFLENAILDNTHIERIVCQDVDPKAIDKGFNRYKERKDGKLMFFACYNLIFPIYTNLLKPAYERLRSDVVLALALTHHLILDQGCTMDFAIEEIKKYTRKYAFIEFMPLGLWVPGSKPTLPDWYTRDNFRSVLLKHFDILLEEQLEENRILFIGRLK